MFHHVLVSQNCGRFQKSLAIILSLEFLTFYKLSGYKPPITSNNELNEEYGRFIGLKLSIEVKPRFKGAFSKKKKKNKSQTINLFISSVYHPVDYKDQLIFNNFLSSIYDTIPSSYIIMSGQDMNANIGISNNKLQCNNVGKFGLNNRNAKGVEAVNLLRTHNLYAPITFFKHKHVVTWKSFDGSNTPFQLDQWITSHLNHVHDCKVIKFGVPSDHSAILIKVKFKTLKKKIMACNNNIDWNMLLDEENKYIFNNKIENKFKEHFSDSKEKK